MGDFNEILRSYDVQFLREIPDNLICILCDSVLNNCTFAPCGCKFCIKCIEHYLKAGNKRCPGKKKECFEIDINYDKDIFPDPSRDLEISYLIAYCPRPSCCKKFQLKHLPDHMRLCSVELADCLFSEVGCSEKSIRSDKVKEHFDSSNVAHFGMLLSYLKQKEVEMQQQVNDVRRVLDTQNDTIRLLAEKNVKIEKECASLKEDLLNSQMEVKILHQRLKDWEQKHVNRVWCFEDSLLHFENEIENNTEFKEESSNIQAIDENREIIRTDEESKDLPDQITVVNACSAKSRRRKKKSKNNKQQTEIQVPQDDHKLERNIVTNKFMFLWKIDNVNFKYNECLSEYSEQFYSDGSSGYKMCLFYWLSKMDGLILTFHLLRSDDDDLIQWPMDRTVEISILNQETGKPAISQQFNRVNASDREYPELKLAAYERPEHMNSWSDGYVFFKSYAQLKQMRGVIKADSIVVTCYVLPF